MLVGFVTDVCHVLDTMFEVAEQKVETIYMETICGDNGFR